MDLIKFGPSSFMINIILDIQYIVQIISKSNEEGLGLQAKGECSKYVFLYVHQLMYFYYEIFFRNKMKVTVVQYLLQNE